MSKGNAISRPREDQILIRKNGKCSFVRALKMFNGLVMALIRTVGGILNPIPQSHGDNPILVTCVQGRFLDLRYKPIKGGALPGSYKFFIES